MSRYGIDYYGLGYYGSDNPIKFDATPFTAIPSKQGQILLDWTTPSGSWSQLVIVRNPYGFPVNVWDGTQVYSVYNGVGTSYFQDTGLVQGNYYYYSIFVFSLVQYNWVNAGNAFGLSVKDCGNTTKLYNYLPEIYKITAPYSPSSDWDNPDLYAFLSNFGFELDYEQTSTDLLLNRYDTQKVNGSLIPTMMNQFGQTYEPALGLQQNRILLRDGVTLTEQKGSKEGLLGFVKDFTGWGVPVPISGTPNPSTNGITVGHNIMLDYNDSSFEESTGHWNSADGSADMDSIQVLNISSVSLTSNVATLIIGAHQYDVGNKVTISGLPLPLFNTSTPVTLTAVNQASSISFALTSTNVSSTSGYNPATGLYGVVTPYPSPWVEPTAPTLFPNKAIGVLALTNLNSSAGAVTIYCGDDAPITNGIPVTGGTTYSFSFYVANGGTARSVTPSIKWYNRFGVYLSTSTGSAVTDSSAIFSSSYRPYVTAAAPSTAYYATPGLSVAAMGNLASNEHHYIDAAQFEASSSLTSFDEARQLHLTLRANRINELINPNFSAAATPWASTNATQTLDTTYQAPNAELYSITTASIVSNVATVTLSTPHEYQVGQSVTIKGVTGTYASNYNGARTVTAVTLNTFSYAVTATNSTVTSGSVFLTGSALKATATGTSVAIKSWDGATTSQQMGIYYPNTSYTFSMYVQAVTSTEASVAAKIVWYDISHAVISSSTGATTSVATGGWTRVYVTGTAPATAAYATVEIDWTTTSTHVLLIDQGLFENNGQVLTYFDGSTGPGTAYDLFWEGGITNGARSHLYKNRFAVQTRLFGATLNAQLPMGSTAAVYIAQPQT